jgi:hypothetical protein
MNNQFKITQKYPFHYLACETFTLGEDVIYREWKSLITEWKSDYSYDYLYDETFESRIGESGWQNLTWFMIIAGVMIAFILDDIVIIPYFSLSLASISFLIAIIFFCLQFKKDDYVTFTDDENVAKFIIKKKNNEEFISELIKRIKHARDSDVESDKNNNSSNKE